MAAKILVFAAVIALARAGLLQHGQSAYSTVQQHPSALLGVAPLLHTVPAAVPVVQTRVEPYDPNPRYNFAYAVNDQVTGDSKSQQESRVGDVVHGQYSLTDPDGSRRIVDYSAGPLTGFNAVVRRTVGAHPVPVATVAATPVHLTAGH